MKKIILTMSIIAISASSLAVSVDSRGVFNHKIPQPNKITNGDFDGDGILDTVDDDTDNDGLNNDEDSLPFDPSNGGFKTPNSGSLDGVCKIEFKDIQDIGDNDIQYTGMGNIGIKLDDNSYFDFGNMNSLETLRDHAEFDNATVSATSRWNSTSVGSYNIDFAIQGYQDNTGHGSYWLAGSTTTPQDIVIDLHGVPQKIKEIEFSNLTAHTKDNQVLKRGADYFNLNLLDCNDNLLATYQHDEMIENISVGKSDIYLTPDDYLTVEYKDGNLELKEKPATIITYEASNVSIYEGAQTNLYWRIDGGKNYTLSSADIGTINVKSNGSIKISPSETTTYTLFDGENSHNVEVTVSAPPVTLGDGALLVSQGNGFFGYVAPDSNRKYGTTTSYGIISGDLSIDGISPAYIISNATHLYISYNNMTGTQVCSFVDSFEFNGSIVSCSNSTKRTYDQYWIKSSATGAINQMESGLATGTPFTFKINYK
jgi:hypothetical protein